MITDKSVNPHRVYGWLVREKALTEKVAKKSREERRADSR
jgi:hypothetical protein